MSVTSGRQVVLGPFLNMTLDPPRPFTSARLYHYAAGTSTALDIYTDPNLLIPATQPLQSDARGVFVFYANNSYRLQVRTSVSDGDVLLYDWDGVELWHPSATLRSENRGSSYPAATDANRGQIFGKIDGSGDLTEVGINKSGALFAPITFQNDPLVATQQWAKGADLASAATLTLGSDGNSFDVTGSAPITAISATPAGTVIILKFIGSPPITYNVTSMRLANAKSWTPIAGSLWMILSLGSGNYEEVARSAASIEGETQINGVMTGTFTGTYTLAGTGTLSSPAINTPTITNPKLSGAATATPAANIVFTDSVVKGWIAGAVSGGTPSIDDDLNVSSLTDNGVGDYTINWATAFATANYAVAGNFMNATPGSGVPAVEIFSIATGSVRINTWNGSGGGHSVSDYASKFYLMAIGDQ